MLLKKRKVISQAHTQTLRRLNPKSWRKKTPNGVKYEKDTWSKAIWLYFDVANNAKPKF